MVGEVIIERSLWESDCCGKDPWVNLWGSCPVKWNISKMICMRVVQRINCEEKDHLEYMNWSDFETSIKLMMSFQVLHWCCKKNVSIQKCLGDEEGHNLVGLINQLIGKTTSHCSILQDMICLLRGSSREKEEIERLVV